MKQQREVIVFDNLSPEVGAMSQALYSRSPKPIKEHFASITEEGAEKFMATFYIGYGHKSIADCGSTTVCTENISMLAAKAIQNWPLYSGQEASTRYLDFSDRYIVDPLGTPESKEIHARWMALYNKTLQKLFPYLTDKYPRVEDEDEKVYRKTVNAKAFDIARGFLPAGMSTYVSWHTNLRQAADHLKTLRMHPLPEVRAIGTEVEAAFQEKYPGSFNGKRYEKEEAYLAFSRHAIEYSDEDLKGLVYASHLKEHVIDKYIELFINRPEKAELPQELRKCGTIDLYFPLDFGSYRDAQRQRSWVHVMPLLTLRHGFHHWYLDSLPEDFRDEAVAEIQAISELVRQLPCDKYVLQYYIAMGFIVACEMEANLPSAVYITELRSGQTVHPTLRPIAQWIADILLKEIPGIALYYDSRPDEWSTRRGHQDIVAKATA